MIRIVTVSFLEKSIQSIYLISVILVIRKYLNIKSTKWANIILWTILFLYLLTPFSILIDMKDENIFMQYEVFLKPISLTNKYAKLFALEYGYILSKINRYFVSALVGTYAFIQMHKMNRALNRSTSIKKDMRIENYISMFNFKRKITVLLNDDIRFPITYGIIRPKVILQSNILEDDELLKYVLIHELTHIKKFDIVFTHIKNLSVCFYWYSPLILVASKYVEEDIEILCDKLVIQKVGDTNKHRKEYCLSMLKIVKEREHNCEQFILKFNPMRERIIIMRKWKQSLAGLISFLLIVVMSTCVFADIRSIEEDRVVTSETPTPKESLISEKVQVISDEEYDKLEKGAELPIDKFVIADFDEKEKLDGLSNIRYSFDMASWTEPNHNGFTIKLSDMFCRTEIDYEIIIQEDGDNIYKKHFNKATNITVKAHNNSKYTVLINNLSTDVLKYKVKINSYIRK